MHPDTPQQKGAPRLHPCLASLRRGSPARVLSSFLHVHPLPQPFLSPAAAPVTSIAAEAPVRARAAHGGWRESSGAKTVPSGLPRLSLERKARCPLPSGLYPSVLPPALSYTAGVATDADGEAGRPLHQPAWFPRGRGLLSGKSRFPQLPPRPSPHGRRRLFRGSRSAGRAACAS